MPETDNSISLKYDFESIKEIDYPHLTIKQLSESVDTNNPTDLLKYIKDNKIIIDTSESENEASDIALVFDAFLLTATKSLPVLASAKGEIKSKFEKDFNENPEFFEERINENGEFEIYYRKPLVLEDAFTKLASSVKDIYIYSPKAINALSTVNGLSSLPKKNEQNRKYLFSQTTSLPILNYSYFGNATLLGYAMSLTFLVKTSKGYHSIYSLIEDNANLVSDIMNKGMLSEISKDFTNQLVDDLKAKQDIEKESEEPVNNLLKQIYFPINTKEDHLLVIVNHAGLRKGISQYMTLLRNSSFYYNGKELDKNKIHKIRIPTRGMNVGGAQPQNSGEVLNSIGGNLRMLSADAPTRLRMEKDKISNYQLANLMKTKNIFSLIHNRYFIIKNNDKKKRNHHLKMIFSKYVNQNMHTKKAREIALKEIAYKMLFPVFNAINNRDSFEDVIEKMPPEMQKMISPDIYKGSITSENYDTLVDMAYKEISKHLFIKIDNEFQMLDSESINVLKKQIEKILRKV